MPDFKYKDDQFTYLSGFSTIISVLLFVFDISNPVKNAYILDELADCDGRMANIY
jgi:hypothetical protein